MQVFGHLDCKISRNGPLIHKSNLYEGNKPDMDAIMKTCPYNIQYFFSSKIDNFQRKKFDIFLIFAQNIDCAYTLETPCRGGSNQYPQSMFWSKNKKYRYTLA